MQRDTPLPRIQSAQGWSGVERAGTPFRRGVQGGGETPPALEGCNGRAKRLPCHVERRSRVARCSRAQLAILLHRHFSLHALSFGGRIRTRKGGNSFGCWESFSPAHTSITADTGNRKTISTRPNVGKAAQRFAGGRLQFETINCARDPWHSTSLRAMREGFAPSRSPRIFAQGNWRKEPDKTSNRRSNNRNRRQASGAINQGTTSTPQRLIKRGSQADAKTASNRQQARNPRSLAPDGY